MSTADISNFGFAIAEKAIKPGAVILMPISKKSPAKVEQNLRELNRLVNDTPFQSFLFLPTFDEHVTVYNPDDELSEEVSIMREQFLNRKSQMEEERSASTGEYYCIVHLEAIDKERDCPSGHRFMIGMVPYSDLNFISTDDLIREYFASLFPDEQDTIHQVDDVSVLLKKYGYVSYTSFNRFARSGNSIIYKEGPAR